MHGLLNSLSELSLVFYVSASMLVQAEARNCFEFLSNSSRLSLTHKTIEEVSIPRIEVKSNDENVLVSIVIPEFSARDLQLKITDQSLIVKGAKIVIDEKAKSGGGKKTKTICKAFQRIIDFPSSVWSEKADAQFDNGVLTLTVPVSAESRKHCIASIVQVH